MATVCDMEEKTNKKEVSVTMQCESHRGTNVELRLLQEHAIATQHAMDVDVQLEAIDKHRRNLLEELCHVNESNLETEFTTDNWVDQVNR